MLVEPVGLELADPRYVDGDQLLQLDELLAPRQAFLEEADSDVVVRREEVLPDDGQNLP